jgi:hypothetical protein
MASVRPYIGAPELLHLSANDEEDQPPKQRRRLSGDIDPSLNPPPEPAASELGDGGEEGQ